LTVGANLADNLANLGLETHVKHSVGLVENEVGNTTKISLAGLQHVDETTGGGDTDFDTSAEVTDLGALGDTSVDASVSDARRATEFCDFLLNLDSKLTGGSKHEDDRTVSRGKKGLGIDVDDGGKTIRKSLSGSGLGNTDDISSRESHGPALGLNGSWGGEALGLYLVHHVSWEAGFVEGLDGLRYILAGNSNGMLLPEGIDFSGAALSNFGVLLVEVLLELG